MYRELSRLDRSAGVFRLKHLVLLSIFDGTAAGPKVSIDLSLLSCALLIGRTIPSLRHPNAISERIEARRADHIVRILSTS
jgi:hypothetical protein